VAQSPLAVDTGPVFAGGEPGERDVDAGQRFRPHLDQRELDVALDVGVGQIDVIRASVRWPVRPWRIRLCTSSRISPRRTVSISLRSVLRTLSVMVLLVCAGSMPEATADVCPVVHTCVSAIGACSLARWS
jgi:hypothetical protein